MSIHVSFQCTENSFKVRANRKFDLIYKHVSTPIDSAFKIYIEGLE